MSSDGEIKESDVKRQKKSDGTEMEMKQFLKDFSLNRVLKDDTKVKLMVLQGRFDGKNDDAVVLLEKLPFDRVTVENMLTESHMHQTLNNDIYSTFESFTPATFPGFKTTMIYPATEKHIAKYSEQDIFIIQETKELYETVTKPCLQKNFFGIQWIYNILDKKQESERIVFEDADPENGFILLPDMKWNRKDLDNLYLVAIAHKRDIMSLRELNSEYLPLLKNILSSGIDAIKKQFDIPLSKLRIYVHYQPSYYHLHVHFTHVKFDAPGTDVLKAHLLPIIIDNIERDGNYYRDQTLHYAVRENDVLYKAYKESGYFR